MRVLDWPRTHAFAPTTGHWLRLLLLSQWLLLVHLVDLLVHHPAWLFIGRRHWVFICIFMRHIFIVGFARLLHRVSELIDVLWSLCLRWFDRNGRRWLVRMPVVFVWVLEHASLLDRKLSWHSVPSMLLIHARLPHLSLGLISHPRSLPRPPAPRSQPRLTCQWLILLDWIWTYSSYIIEPLVNSFYVLGMHGWTRVRLAIAIVYVWLWILTDESLELVWRQCFLGMRHLLFTFTLWEVLLLWGLRQKTWQCVIFPRLSVDRWKRFPVWQSDYLLVVLMDFIKTHEVPRLDALRL